MKGKENLQRLMKQLYEKAYIGKNNHYFAAKRVGKWERVTGLPAVVINVILGSVLFADLSVKVPDLLKWVALILALVAAILGSVQTYHRFQWRFEGHRRVGRLLLEVQNELELLLPQVSDEILSLKTAYRRLNSLNQRYVEIISEAEAFPTTEKDYTKSSALLEGKEATDPFLRNESSNVEDDKAAIGQTSVSLLQKTRNE
jgi:hypothetical protein